MGRISRVSLSPSFSRVSEPRALVRWSSRAREISIFLHGRRAACRATARPRFTVSSRVFNLRHFLRARLRTYTREIAAEIVAGVIRRIACETFFRGILSLVVNLGAVVCGETSRTRRTYRILDSLPGEKAPISFEDNGYRRARAYIEE